MWNCSAPPSVLLPFGDDCVKCKTSSSSQAGGVGLDRILAADYDMCHTLNLSSSLQSLQAPMFLPMHGSHGYIGGSSIYNGGEDSQVSARQLDCTQPTTATLSVKWMAAGETVTGEGSRLRGSKRLKTTTATTAQGPPRGPRCNSKSMNQSVKAPCKRSQRLGDKITALQQLVSPYGKTDTASVLQEAATCIKQLHQQIQIITASYPERSSPTSRQDTGEEDEEEAGLTDLRRRGLCLAPYPAVVELVSAGATRGHQDIADTGANSAPCSRLDSYKATMHGLVRFGS